MGYPYSAGEVLQASDMNAVGLHLVTPTGVTNGTLDGATVTLGSAVSSVTVSGVFSANFQNYKIIIDGVDGSLANNSMDFNFDGSTTGYYFAGWYRNYANTTGGFTAVSNGSSWAVGYTSTSNSTYCSFEVFHPYDSTRRAHYASAPSGGDDFVNSYGGQHAVVSSFTGFRIVPGLGTMTGGTIRVYGYSNG